MRAIIKGNMIRALMAAEAHGVTVKKAAWFGNDGTTTIIADDADETRILKWFMEVTMIIPGFGYETGTCLYYAKHDDEI